MFLGVCGGVNRIKCARKEPQMQGRTTSELLKQNVKPIAFPITVVLKSSYGSEKVIYQTQNCKILFVYISKCIFKRKKTKPKLQGVDEKKTYSLLL